VPTADHVDIETGVFRPLGTLSGDFDAAKVPQLRVEITAKTLDERSIDLPSPASHVLLVVSKNGPHSEYQAAVERGAFIPGGHEIIRIIDPARDDMEQVLKRVQTLRIGIAASMAGSARK
jgi:hypothetical protein